MLQAAFVTYRKFPDLSDDDWNSPAAIRWNRDKSYLQEIQAAGVPVVPTLLLKKSSSASLPRLLDQQAWSRAVVKPSISASAFRTWMTTPATAPAQQADLDSLLARSGVMIQEYFPEVETAGEWSLIFLDGEYSHAVRKRPRPGDFRVQEELGGTVQPASPSRSIVDQATRVLAAAAGPAPLLYARVDGLVREGKFFLMEIELIEPSLFLGFNPGAPARFAAAIRRTIDNAKGSLDGGDRG